MNISREELRLQIINLTAEKKIAGCIAILICFVALFFTFIIMPQRDKITELTAVLQKEEQAVTVLENYDREHPQEEQYLAELDQKMVSLGMQLPDGSNMGNLLMEIEQAAKSTDTQLISVKPGQAVNQKGYRAYSAEVVVSSNLYNLQSTLSFMDKLQHLSRYTNVTSVSTESKENQLVTKLAVFAYSFGQLPEEKKAGTPKK